MKDDPTPEPVETAPLNPGTGLADVTGQLRDFADRRNWAQFHTPKNLSMALAAEAGELLAELQWLTDPQITDKLAHDPHFPHRITSEIADIGNYLLRFADVCGINLIQAMTDKIALNETRYPQDRAYGSAEKYTSYTDPRDPTKGHPA